MKIFEVVIRKETIYRGIVEASDKADAYAAAFRRLEANSLNVESDDPIVWIEEKKCQPST